VKGQKCTKVNDLCFNATATRRPETPKYRERVLVICYFSRAWGERAPKRAVATRRKPTTAVAVRA